MSHRRWHIHLFGPLCAQSNDLIISRFRTQKTGTMLAYLASSPDRAYRREEIMDMLWPGYDLDAGRNNLRVSLNSLRQQFEIGGRNAPFVADRVHIRFNHEAATTDKAEWEAVLARATRAEEDETRLALLQQAVGMYRSDFLSGYDAPWIVAERLRLADAHVIALRRLVQLEAKQRHFDAALEYAQAAIAVDPLREESHRVVMQLYAAAGRTASAVRQYRDMERVLSESLGATPSQISRTLIAQISAATGSSATASAQSAVIAPSDAADKAIAVLGGGRESGTFLPPGTSSFGNLPKLRTRYFGREDSLAQIQEMFDTPETRLVTLTGLGGSGKTRLAITAAERMASRNEAVHWFVSLAALTNAEQIPDAILDAMKHERDKEKPIFEQLIGALTAVPTMLVLDNMEQLGSEGSRFVSRLLDAAPRLRCLVTSRQRLNIAGEYEISVAPLPTPATPGTPERLLEFASVQIFVDRAQMVKPGFTLTSANAAAVAALCHHLEGVPLAIEIAAGWAQTLTLRQMLLRLTPRLPMLTHRQKDAPTRHVSLRVALHWSFDLLPPETQIFFTRLAVFRGGWTLAAAETVCEEPQALELLTELREHSLLEAQEIGEEMRYRFLETVREFAWEQISEEDMNKLPTAAAFYYLHFAEALEPALNGSESAQHLDALERERDNIRAAFQTWQTEPEQQLRLAGALRRFWYLRGGYEEGLRWLLDSLAATGANAAPAYRRKGLRGAGNLLYGMAKLDRAEAIFQELLALTRETGPPADQAAALGSLGNIALARQNTEAAEKLLTESLEIFRRGKDGRGVSIALGNLARTAAEAGQSARAITLYEECIPLFRSLQDDYNLLLALNNLADSALRLRDVEKAQACVTEALDLAVANQYKHGIAVVLVNWTTLLIQKRQFSLAALCMGAADAILSNLQTALMGQMLIEYKHDRATLEAELSPETFQDSYKRGMTLPPEQLPHRIQEGLSTSS